MERCTYFRILAVEDIIIQYFLMHSRGGVHVALVESLTCEEAFPLPPFSGW
jgi:hypothetical protein